MLQLTLSYGEPAALTQTTHRMDQLNSPSYTSVMNYSSTSNHGNHKTGFLDLPAEIRDKIYHLTLPKQCTIMYHPPLFKDAFPKEVHVKPYRIDHRIQHATFLALSHTNRQLRTEIRSIFYGRSNASAYGLYHFQTYFKYRRCELYPEQLAEWLSTSKYLGAELLQDAGIPFAVLKKASWFSFMGIYKYELLVPDWRSGYVKWRKFGSIGAGNSDEQDEVMEALSPGFRNLTSS